MCLSPQTSSFSSPSRPRESGTESAVTGQKYLKEMPRSRISVRLNAGLASLPRPHAAKGDATRICDWYHESCQPGSTVFPVWAVKPKFGAQVSGCGEKTVNGIEENPRALRQYPDQIPAGAWLLPTSGQDAMADRRRLQHAPLSLPKIVKAYFLPLP
jgi:hypothetical protein